MITFAARRWSGCLLAAVILLVNNDYAMAAPKIVIDCAKTNGQFRALNGVNGGVLSCAGTTDYSAYHRRAGFPMVRLHDCPYANPSVVDVHEIFRDFRDDPAAIDNYSFERTDDFIAPIFANGSQVLYRLGESIEHTQRKYDVHPPRDYDKWAAICLGIIRHYNEGWTNGFHYGIRYWEIWNEADNQPAMWTGSNEDYYRLYEVSVKAIKKEFPNLKLGGPAVGNPGGFQDGVFVPSPFVAGFLKHCKDHAVPLDFFSWHVYTDDPGDVCRRARAIRSLLDSSGFAGTESHLNEWNYLPGNDWSGHITHMHKAREDWYNKVTGPQGAVFAAATLLELQDEPLDMAFFYTSDSRGFGLFEQWGRPKASFYAFEAFHKFLATPQRVGVAGLDKNLKERLTIGAGKSAEGNCVQILLSHRSTKETIQFEVENLPWTGPTHIAVQEIKPDGLVTVLERNAGAGKVNLRLPLAPSRACLLKLTPR